VTLDRREWALLLTPQPVCPTEVEATPKDELRVAGSVTTHALGAGPAGQRAEVNMSYACRRRPRPCSGDAARPLSTAQESRHTPQELLQLLIDRYGMVDLGEILTPVL